MPVGSPLELKIVGRRFLVVLIYCTRVLEYSVSEYDARTTSHARSGSSRLLFMFQKCESDSCNCHSSCSTLLVFLMLDIHSVSRNTRSVGLSIHFHDVTLPAEGGEEVRFTLFYPASNQWEGRDFEITILNQ